MFDISLNLTSPQFDKDRNEIVFKAFQAGVNGLLITSTNLHESILAKELVRRYPKCWSTVGIHPHNSNMWTPESAETLYMLAQNKKVIAIGECGLDLYRNFSSFKDQKKIFIAQLAIASELEMPVFLHCRNAYDQLFALIKPWISKLPGLILHCFTGSYQHARLYLKNGINLGISGWICDQKRGLELRTLLPCIPTEQLFLETDSPYLLPRNAIPTIITSNRNEPAYLPYILHQVALLRQEEPKIFERKIDENVRRLFNIIF